VKNISYKSSPLKYFLVIFCLFFTAKANSLELSNYLFYVSIIAILLYLEALKKRSIPITKQLIVILFLITAFTFIQFLVFGRLTLGFLFDRFMLIIATYIVTKITKLEFFKILEEILYKLAVISLPLYVLQLINFNFLQFMIVKVQSVIPFLVENPNHSNIFIWGYQTQALSRNQGFMWEPGAFAAILLVGILINLIFNNFSLNKKLVFMLIALLTTLSTMGYIGLFVLLIFYLYNKRMKYFVISLPIILVISAIVINLPFMRNKIIDEYNNVDNKIYDVYNENRSKDMMSLGRMASFKVDIIDMMQSPIFGLGGNTEAKTTSNSIVVNKTNGLSLFLVTWGLLGFVLLLYSLIRLFKILLSFNRIKGVIFPVMTILILSFSNNVLQEPVFGVLILFSYFYKRPILWQKPLTL